MNVLRDALSTYRRTFRMGCIGDLMCYTGLTLLFWVSWKVGAGIMLVLGAQELVRRTNG